MCKVMLGLGGMLGWVSVVPRLPCSGMRTLKLYTHGELGAICHVGSAKGRHKVVCVGVTKTQDSKKERT